MVRREGCADQDEEFGLDQLGPRNSGDWSGGNSGPAGRGQTSRTGLGLVAAGFPTVYIMESCLFQSMGL